MHLLINSHIRGVDHGYANMLDFIVLIFYGHEGAVLVHIFDPADDRAIVAELEEIRPLLPAGEGKIFRIKTLLILFSTSLRDRSGKIRIDFGRLPYWRGARC
jgi:hypothetical protein